MQLDLPPFSGRAELGLFQLRLVVRGAIVAQR
jgi:hypothetical protein